MKKFHFRLEQVLQQKIKQEEQALLEQAKAQEEYSRCEKELAATRDKLEESYQTAQLGLRPEDQLYMLMFRDSLRELRERQMRNLQRANEILQNRIKISMKARQERKIFEKLKEKQLMEYRELQLFLEQKEIDELATMSYARGTHQSGVF
ncbi:flagellar export protein FliJ [Desulforamulus reducens MI-1]|uniref:Flagellar FliJ protein n=1 Tax=Desulforamulus reducens (strain ATCC BAA-1160 / DSM 100696 / MI-1) TaxID=349161 RepID=A4J761_DESRM|nr:flagellar export protein FliJ [Desulforamulus reducens]ABO50914.1 flagellar export protein FliJ [Desulforamulus reducens MI-1]